MKINNKNSLDAFGCLANYPWRLLLSLLTVFILLSPDTVLAHVKWFAPYDISVAPRTLGAVLTTEFVLIASMSVLFVTAVLVVDNLSFQKITLVEWIYQAIHKELPALWAYTSIRFTMLIFFTCLFVMGNVILSPETKHENLIVPTIQCVIVASLLNRWTSPLGGLGMVVLWGIGVYKYGFFHMSDYIMFLGLAFFLILGGQAKEQYRSIAYTVLVLSLSFSLLWASIEKFVYPEWSFQILDQMPELQMGIPKEIFMNIAGFVEFAMAFLVITTSGLGLIFATLGLNFIFISAIFLFGKVDAIGHSPVIVAFFVIALWGPSRINQMFHRLNKCVAVNSGLLVVFYVSALVSFFGLYYGIRHVWMSMA